MIPALAALLLCHNRYAGLPLVLIVGLVTNIPFAVLIKLGQDYLPTRPAPPRESPSASLSAQAASSNPSSESSLTITARKGRSPSLP